MPTVAINGLGRIGRAALKILLDSDGLELAAVNDIAAADNLAYLLNYDTVYGRYHHKVSAEDGALVVDDRRIPVPKRDLLGATAIPAVVFDITHAPLALSGRAPGPRHRSSCRISDRGPESARAARSQPRRY